MLPCPLTCLFSPAAFIRPQSWLVITENIYLQSLTDLLSDPLQTLKPVPIRSRLQSSVHASCIPSLGIRHIRTSLYIYFCLIFNFWPFLMFMFFVSRAGILLIPTPLGCCVRIKRGDLCEILHTAWTWTPNPYTVWRNRGQWSRWGLGRWRRSCCRRCEWTCLFEETMRTGIGRGTLFSPSVTERLAKPTSHLPGKGPPSLPPHLHRVLKGQRNFSPASYSPAPEK